MSTKTVVPLKRAIMAHVPVDRVEIEYGPGAAFCMNARNKLESGEKQVRLLFTLSTGASKALFRRHLQVASIFAVENGRFNFTAIFCGQVVSGIYDMNKRTGWFNLD